MPTHLHPVLTVVLLFFLGLISPGPNFLVVGQATLNFGRSAGLVTGLGAALGDAIYAGLGLFGVIQLTRLGPAIVVVDLVGGGYLAWLGAGLTSQRRFGGAWRDSGSTGSASPRAHFWRGLATDLANPKTVVFFVGIFAIAVTPATPGMVRAVMLLGIVLTSALWRFFVSFVFSTSFIRQAYERTQGIAERVFGAALFFFGVLLAKRALW
jgi:amino acid exporter